MIVDEPTHRRAERRPIHLPVVDAIPRCACADAEVGIALSAERVAEVRRRIFRGTYDSAAVVDIVARRILESGDL